MPNYGEADYWENRYKNPDDSTFDWLEDYTSLKDMISNLNIPKKTGTILNLGCGNSELCEEMYDDGYLNIINIDISQNVIDYMKKRNLSRDKMSFLKMDVRDLKIEDNSIDFAVDKSTIDALLCGNNSFQNVALMLKEVQRVLKVGGYYMIISYGAPESRVFHLKRKFLDFEVQILTTPKDYENDDAEEGEEIDKNNYVYICKKLPGADAKSKKFFDITYSELEKEEEEYEKQTILDECDLNNEREGIQTKENTEENNCIEQQNKKLP